MKLLDLDTHRQKWTLIFNGIKGEKGEDEQVTRSKIRSFAKDKLKVTGADLHPMAACHRLSQKQNAAIIVKFVDLMDRNVWLFNGKNLRNSETIKIRCFKTTKVPPPAHKQKSAVKYLPNWPYVCLSIKGQTTKYPIINKAEIVNKYLDQLA